MKRKIIAIFSLLATVLLTGGLGCKGLSADEQAAIQPISLTYWTVYGDIDELRALAAEYSQLRTYVTVNIRQIRYDELEERLLTALADDVPPDIISIPAESIPQYLKWLEPMPRQVSVSNVYTKGTYAKETVVERVVQPMPTLREIESTFVQAVVDDAVIGNQVYGLPLSLDTLALYYNKNLLDLSGIPTPPRTWDDFQKAVEQIVRYDVNGNVTQVGVGLGTGSNVNNAADILALLMLQNGVEPIKGNRVAFHAGMEKNVSQNHKTFESLRFYTQFSDKTKKAYTWNEKQEQALDAFVRGKSAFYIGYARDFAQMSRRAQALNLEVIPLPQLNPNRPTNVTSYWVESVVEKSNKGNHAWDFVRFMTTERNIRKYVESTRLPSPVRTHVTLFQDDEVLGPFAQQVLFAKTWYSGRDADRAKRAFADLIEAYRLPGATDKKKLENDVNAVNYAAQIIQQTL
ncbi:extracellular solute-binding protein [Candidatus Nomurabacteria bacterium]|nr:extracellular solute-binding protein [Candidatus Nomurabacteria bacterium]